jgi:dTDP-4-amino-4,6-dideoxygalactose transaminase
MQRDQEEHRLKVFEVKVDALGHEYSMKEFGSIAFLLHFSIHIDKQWNKGEEGRSVRTVSIDTSS